ncbi:hypothetical protein ARMSODRAFT_1002972 [Armillaria solidipes]|uniref:Uncharacterized protein n=1 Tax=Armillaria solidipes TaxID=1076256 RepID=A0A2H3BJT7_9AGAR|nr:hypothetical protein ARMSODRAFT_1002972 [Armillaria solidipes]
MNCTYPERPSTFSFKQKAPIFLNLWPSQLGYRSGKGGPVPWSPSLEGHLLHAVREIQEGVAPNWFELIRDDENRLETKIWKDWMWEVSTWRYRLLNHNTELSAYREPTARPVHPPSFRSRLVFEYISGVSMAKLKPGVDVSMREAERIWRRPRAIEAENCVLHNVIHIGNVVLRDGSRSPVSIDFGQTDIREPDLSDEEWSGVSRYTLHEEPSESMPEDFRKEMFERVLDTDWEGARIRLGMLPSDWSKIKRFEPITVGSVLLVERHSGDEKAVLKLVDQGYCGSNGRLLSKGRDYELSKG